MEKLILPGIFILALLYPIYQRLIFRDKSDKGPELTGQATIKSHRVEQGNFQGQAPLATRAIPGATGTTM
jgi:hypothetical protein